LINLKFTKINKKFLTMFINHGKLPIQIRGLIGSSAAQAASIAGFVCTACGRPIQARSDRQHKVQPQPRC